MNIRLGINGFGRMGRLGLRAGWTRPEFEFVHINEIATDVEGSAHLLKYDSVHGTWGGNAGTEGNKMIINGKELSYSSNHTIDEGDW